MFYAQSTSAVISGRLAERRPAELIYAAETMRPQILQTAEIIIILKVFVKCKIWSVETILSALIHGREKQTAVPLYVAETMWPQNLDMWQRE